MWVLPMAMAVMVYNNTFAPACIILTKGVDRKNLSCVVLATALSRIDPGGNTDS